MSNLRAGKHVTDQPLHIALNATAMLTPLTGIGRYVKELALALTRLGVVIDYFDVAHGWRHRPPETLAAPTTGRLSFLHNLPKIRPLWRQLQQLRFSKGISSNHSRLYHEPNYLAFRFNGPTVVTAHDASWVRYPETHPIQRVRIMNRHFPESLERADRIIVVSDFVAREMNTLFGTPFERIRTISHGVAGDFQPMSAAETAPVCKHFKLDHGGYVLAVGTLEPRKNLISLIRAYRLLPTELSRQYPLVIAGMGGWQHDQTDLEMARLERQGVLRVLGQIDEDALPSLYAAAKLFVYPSIYEGFGLPPLEAMASGIPVIVSDRTSLPEVVGPAGMLIDPYDIDAMSEAMRSVLEDPQRQQSMAGCGLKRASQFTWSRCAQETLDVYNEALAL
ncbi:MAG: glycosyltransferase family 4 protein [Betaproteobacteria bacterium]|nr:glycosyltransferase family 4 protein [Betaproteobacteria bacterium]